MNFSAHYVPNIINAAPSPNFWLRPDSAFVLVSDNGEAEEIYQVKNRILWET